MSLVAAGYPLDLAKVQVTAQWRWRAHCRSQYCHASAWVLAGEATDLNTVHGVHPCPQVIVSA